MSAEEWISFTPKVNFVYTHLCLIRLFEFLNQGRSDKRKQNIVPYAQNDTQYLRKFISLLKVNFVYTHPEFSLHPLKFIYTHSEFYLHPFGIMFTPILNFIYTHLELCLHPF